MATKKKLTDLAKKPPKTSSIPVRVTTEDAVKLEQIAVARGQTRTSLMRSMVADLINNAEHKKAVTDLAGIQSVITQERETIVKLLTAMTEFLSKEVAPQLKTLNEKVEFLNERNSL